MTPLKTIKTQAEKSWKDGGAVLRILAEYLEVDPRALEAALLKIAKEKPR